MRKMSRWIAGIAVVGAGIVGGVIALVIANAGNSTRTITTTVVQQASHSSEPTSFANDNSTGKSINQIYKESAPSVVDIKVVTKSSANSLGGLFGGGGQQQQGGEGAGVIYDAQGDIITDEHVVANATSVHVLLHDGKTYPAKVLGTDASTDVGVIKLQGAPSSQIHPLKFANSGDAQVGDPVVAIGSPFGYPETVTSGIVSQTGRQIKAPNGWQISDAIQTDAAINPGNSGGPLLNANGEVLGLNDQIETDGSSSASGEGQSSGIGFATPGNTDVQVANQIIKTGAAIHPYLGVSLEPAKNGAEVAQILPNSPGGKAGLQVNDVITKVNSTAVTGTEQLITTLNKFKPGDSVTLTVQRQGQTKQVKVTLTNRPETTLGQTQ